MTGRTLDGIAVGISISESSDPHDVGFDSDQVNRITVRLIQALLGQGACVVLGHDWRPGGVMNAVLDAAREYGHEWAERGPESPVLVNLVPWPDQPLMSADERRRWSDVLEVEEAGMPAECSPSRVPTDEEELRHLRGVALSHLRKRLVERTQARICVGGRTRGFSGRLPGIVEEAGLAIAAGQPIYLSGLLGGASAALAGVLGSGATPRDALVAFEDRDSVPPRPPHPEVAQILG
jgi:hypothetical protein